MYVCFQLTMLNRGSWDGRWSGEGNVYARVRTFRAAPRVDGKLIVGRSYYYRWSDGWGASVSVREVTSREAGIIRRSSQGFHGYDWMIDSILELGAIKADHEREEAV